MDNNVDIITTNTTRTVQSDGNWAKRFTSSETTIPKGTSLSEELYIRAFQYAKETMSVYQALYMFDGSIDTKTYNQLIDDIYDNMEEMKKRLKIKSYTLVLVENSKIVNTINFDCKTYLDGFCKDKLNCTADDIIQQNIFNIDSRFAGTVVFESQWMGNNLNTKESIKQGS